MPLALSVHVTEFTPAASALGGVLIGIASIAMLVLNGRIAGISGILGGLAGALDRDWRFAFIGGLLGGGALMFALTPQAFGDAPTIGTPALALAGVLVGVGTRMGSGCTSGHGVCGLSRMSARSLVATAVFMAVAALTVFVLRITGGLGA